MKTKLSLLSFTSAVATPAAAVLAVLALTLSAPAAQGATTSQSWTTPGTYLWICPASVRSSTNIALPLTNWSIVATNPFDIYGNFSNPIPLTSGTPQQFYYLQMP